MSPHAVELHAHVLIDVLHVEVLRLGRKVGQHHAVHAEHAVVGQVSEVAAVVECRMPYVERRIIATQRSQWRSRCVTCQPQSVIALRLRHGNGLIHPVPDCSAADIVAGLYGLPEVDEVASGIAHGVGVFRDVERVLWSLAALGSELHPSDRWILVGAHIDDVVVALILHWARGVKLLDGFVGSLEIVAWPGFVAKAPDDDARSVHVRAYHFYIACHVGSAPLLRVRERCVAVIVFVALDVGFILQIDAILVAEIIPVGVVGIV